jgi:hypothetical protein
VAKRQVLLQFLDRGQDFVRIVKVLDFVRGLNTNLPLTVLSLLAIITTLPRHITIKLVLITYLPKEVTTLPEHHTKGLGLVVTFLWLTL